MLDPTRTLHRLRRASGALVIASLAVTTVSACSKSKSPTAAAAATTSASSAPSFPVTIGTGAKAVTLTKAPTQIVSLSATTTEMLFAIGAGSQVKAVDKTSNFPAEAPHTTLDAYQLNVESVAGYKPDLVIGSGLSADQTKQLGKLGVPVIDEPAVTDLDGTYRELTELGQATGHADGAATVVANMKQKIADIVKATPQAPAGSTYYYELDQTYYSVTTSTFVGQVFKLLGLTSIADSAKGAAEAGGYPQLSGEFIVKANPGYVFLADTKCCSQSAATVAKRPGWSAMKAVSAGRVVELDDDIASRWGPRIVDLLQTVADAMKAHPLTP